MITTLQQIRHSSFVGNTKQKKTSFAETLETIKSQNVWLKSDSQSFGFFGFPCSDNSCRFLSPRQIQSGLHQKPRMRRGRCKHQNAG